MPKRHPKPKSARSAKPQVDTRPQADTVSMQALLGDAPAQGRKPKRSALISADDRALWQAMTHDVKPLAQATRQRVQAALGQNTQTGEQGTPQLHTDDEPIHHRAHDRNAPQHNQGAPLPHPGAPTRIPMRMPLLSPYRQTSLQGSAKPPDFLGHGDRVGMDARRMRRMQRGKLDIEARLDLHGMTQDAAQDAVSHFIERCYNQGRRHVIIVTGKGLSKRHMGDVKGGVLRERLPLWLNMSPNRARILSYDYAQPKDGGTGAIYLVLKKRK